MSPDHRHILAPGGVVKELLPERTLHLCGLGDHQESAGILVDAVDQPYRRIIDIKVGVIPQVPSKPIEERPVPVAMPRVDHQSGRLIDHQEPVILVDDLERHLLGSDLEGHRWTLESHRDAVERLDLIIGLHRLAVDEDKAGGGCPLDATAGDLRHHIDEKAVDPQRLLPLICGDGVVLVELVNLLVLLVYRLRLGR